MKRKLFTLLAAFMVLATFQVDAQTKPYDGKTPHWLNIWKANYTGGFTDPTSSPVNAVESAEDYPISGDGYTAVNSSATSTQSIITTKTTGTITRQPQRGALGQTESYYYLTSVGGNPNLYQIKAKAGNAFTFNATEGSKAGQVISNFEFVRFYNAAGVEYSAPLAGPIVGFIPEKSQSVAAQMGGYLSAESNATGTNDRTRYLLVFDVTVNKETKLPTNVYAMVSMDSIRRNWSNVAAGKLPATQRLVPVWVRADQIGGRWANINDFNKVGEFIKFQIGSANDTLAVNDGSTKVNTFSVKQVGELSFQGGSRPAGLTSDPDQSQLNASGAHTAGFGDNGVTGGITKRLTYNTTTTTWGLQYFSLGDPKTGKVVSVAKKNVLGPGQTQGSGVFGDFLEMNNPYTTGVVSDIRTQQFAVWISDTGEMELYPLNAYTCDYPTGKFDVVTPFSPGYNAAVWNDSPKVNSSTPNNNPTGTPGLPTAQDFINASFKLGKYNSTGDKVLSLTDNYNTAYSDLLLNPHPADMINKIQTGRYFFLEVTPKDEFWAYTSKGVRQTMTDKFYVLDVVRQWNAKEGKNVKRVVLTAKERNRYAGTEGRYFDTPYDSVNMSAHWKVDGVYSKEYDPTTSNNHLIGYRFVNEMGDTLEYNYNRNNIPLVDPATGDGGITSPNPLPAWTPDNAVPYTNWYSCVAYLRKDMNPAYYTNGTTATTMDQLIPRAVGTDVWQSVHFSNDGYFKLRNLQWADASNDFRMPKNAGGNIYVDTVRDYNYVDPAANPASSYYWHTGLRGRSASSTGEAKQLEKDVWAVGSLQNAMMIKLTDIEYEYAKGGANPNKTNHTNDSYFPEDDSLCTYLYKEGHYDMIEALSNTLRLEGTYTGPDKVYGKQLAFMTTSTSSDPWLYVEPVDTAEYVTPMYYKDPISGADQLNVDYNLDNYKWHYIRNNSNEYLVYDTINTTTTLVDQQFGFKFKSVDKTNATAFRFYQPLVGDKHLENYIIEFRVPKHVYNVNRVSAVPTVTVAWHKSFSVDNYGINKDALVNIERELGDYLVNPVGAADPLTEQWLANAANPQSTSYAALLTAVKSNVDNKIPFKAWGVTTQQAYKDYLAYEHTARTKYAVLTTGSDLLLSTWNDGRNKANGAPTPATRFKFRGASETQCKRDYVDSQYLLNNGMYALPLSAEEWDVRENVGSGDYMAKNSKSYAIDSAAKSATITLTIADTLKVGTTTVTVGGETFKPGYINRFKPYYTSHTDANNDIYRLYKNTKEIELYYIQNAEGKYLTIDTTSVYAESSVSTITGVSGTRLRWADLYTATSNNNSSVGEKADYRPLQMFAVYGCKSTATPAGTFIFIPSSAWEVKYQSPFNQVRITQNQNIGNGTVTDEFRIGIYGKNSQLVVQPSSETYNQGIVPTEYMFTRSQYYNGNFCHHNFIQDKDSKYLASYGVVAKSYYDPSQHWTVEKKKDAYGKAIDYTYVFTLEAEVNEDGLPVPARTQLKNEYYLIPQDSSVTSFGGKVQKFTAINISAPQDVRTITITCITEKTGDACISKFKKFDDEDLTYDWGIIESIYKDRYVYSRGLADGSGYTNKWGSADAYLAQGGSATSTDGVEFLRLRKSNTDVYAEHHGIPYYNIIHVTRDNKGNEILHYLEMTKDSVKFRLLTPREAWVLENYDQYPDTLQKMKFCFPFAKDGNLQDSASYPNGNKFANLMIRTKAEAGVIQYLAIDKNNTSRVYADPSVGGVFFFGPNAAGDDEWVGPTNKTGWLKDLSQASTYVVNPSAATPVNYGKLSYWSDVQPNLDAAKYEFVLIYQDVVGKYNPKPIWYYKIRVKGDDGKYKYLTTAVDSTHNSDYVYQSGYTYAYFTDEFTVNDPSHPGADKNYSQTFGLKYDRSAMTTEHPYPFWVVAQVPSGAYKYLALFNSRMVFIDAGTESKIVAEDKAMTFEVGKVDDDGTFTDNPTLDVNAVKIYGLTGSVKVVNAKGAIELYTIDGRMFKTVTANGTEETIAAPRGVVIVKNGANVEKVVVK